MKHICFVAALLIITPCFAQRWDPVTDLLQDRPRGSDIRRAAKQQAEAERAAGEKTSKAIITGAMILGGAIIVAVAIAKLGSKPPAPPDSTPPAG